MTRPVPLLRYFAHDMRWRWERRRRREPVSFARSLLDAVERFFSLLFERENGERVDLELCRSSHGSSAPDWSAELRRTRLW